MFCDNCGKKITRGGIFCDYCGKSLLEESSHVTSPISRRLQRAAGIFYSGIKSISTHKLATASLLVFLIVSGFFGYKLYTQIQKELQKTQKELALLRESTTEAISTQQQFITEQSENLSKKEDELQKAQANKALLRKTLDNVQKTKVSNPVSSGISSSLLSEIALSIVKLYCLANSYTEDIRQGSGVLYHAVSKDSEFWPYYVQTNLHVVDTNDGSISKCTIVLYPDYTNSNSYLLFKSESYKFYRNDLDIAFLKPQLVSNNAWAGTFNDLATFARSETKSPICNSVNIGDYLSILGYPGIGGETLTVTDGIISGFEFDGGSRYIKTSAKIEEGNSGGVAIKDSGCVVGIPTFVQRGRIESIGRILDLNYLFNVILK